MRRYELAIGGDLVPGQGGETMAAFNPFSEAQWAEVAVAGAGDVRDAIGAARAAFEGGWRDAPGVERARLLHELARLLDEEAESFAELETTDNGKVVRETRTQMGFAARNYRFFAGAADKLHGQTIGLDDGVSLDYTTLEPHGVAALITAWNSPMQLLANKLAPALAAGNAVVVKPSEHAAATTLELERLAARAGFPPGVVNVVVGGPDVGEALTGDPGVDKISFTGGLATGRRVATAAAANVVPVTLELGGKSANVVFADADLDRAVTGAVAGIFAAAGQTCIAGSRLLVHAAVHDEVLERVAALAGRIRMGDPLDPATEMGPLAHGGQRERIEQEVAAARDAGAQLVAGGPEAQRPSRGYFLAPTVLAGVDRKMRVAQEELFGPVLAVMRFDGDDEAVDIANGTDFGLAAGLWTRDVGRAHRVARQLEAGVVWINTYRASAAQAPFGGVKHSGYGRERGLEALRDYVRVKNTMLDLSEDTRDPFSLRT